MPDVIFFVVGADRVAYGGDLKHIEGKSFLQHVLKQDDYDLSRFVFPGLVPPRELAEAALAQRPAPLLHRPLRPLVVALRRPGVRLHGGRLGHGPGAEVIRHGENGLLADFYDVEGLADLSLRVLRDPEGHRALGRAGMELIRDRYALSVTLPRLLDLYRAGRRPGTPTRGRHGRAPAESARDPLTGAAAAAAIPTVAGP